MAFRTLQINLISAEDLTCPYTLKPIKSNALAVIRLPHTATILSTTLDEKGGSYPYWNETFKLQIPVNAPSFDVRVCCGAKTMVGMATVPVSDFVNSIVPLGYLNCLSYRLRGRNGNFIKGIVNISVRVVNFGTSSENGKISMGRPVALEFGGSAGKKVAEDGGDGACCLKYDRGVVTGIPVSYGMNKYACDWPV
uniref:C2 domain-containing protein n=1 Tax=Kalanchoe fedtschenkoi TaxID=63787 RepID=A0A7N0VAY0_KALFE